MPIVTKDVLKKISEKPLEERKTNQVDETKNSTMPIVTKSVLTSEKPSEELKPDEAAEAVIPAHPIDETEVANLIHKYAVFHAAVALLLGPIAGFALTLITIKMISEISERYGVNIFAQGITNFVAHYVGLLLGIFIAQVINGLIPGIGNLSNAVSSFIVTQIIGWAIVIKGGSFDFKNITEDEWKKIIGKIPILRHMSEDEKKGCATWLVRLFKENANKKETDEAQKEIRQILINYGKNLLGKYGMDGIATSKTDFENQLKNRWANRANDADYQEIESKLLNIVESEQFQPIKDNITDNWEFARCMEILLGYTVTEEQRLKAQNEIKEILKRNGIDIEF